MKRRENFIPLVIMLLIFSGAFYFLSGTSVGSFLGNTVQIVTIPISKTVVGLFTFNGESAKIQKLEKEKEDLLAKLLQLREVEKENVALRDQFETTSSRSFVLVPAHIIGAPMLIPGISSPTEFVISVGQKDGVLENEAVVVGNNLIGIVVVAGNSVSRVLLTSNPKFSLKVKIGESLGVLKGQGENVLVENILLSDSVSVGDTVTTYGEVSSNGIGVPPNLVIGSVVSVNKKASSVFQSADVKSNVILSHVSTVFVIKQAHE